MTFNTNKIIKVGKIMIFKVLNLVINGWPSIQKANTYSDEEVLEVLNLVINGWPSIPQITKSILKAIKKF